VPSCARRDRDIHYGFAFARGALITWGQEWFRFWPLMKEQIAAMIWAVLY
jgi:hypothetical protein